ncbi:hypothetical protein F4803DRAFT_569060 [Xylaria telfairii]|nr:hypothetical protein F4803DRAFT_569060 [Xylaria telfairii]
MAKKLNIHMSGTALAELVLWIREGPLLLFLIVVSRLAPVFTRPRIWSFFWTTYFFSCQVPEVFLQNYLEAWRLTYPAYVITIFIDQINCIHVPCPDPHAADINDLWLLKHLSLFYRMSRIHGGIFQAILPKSLRRIDIVKVERRLGEYNAGQPTSTMDLGNQIPGQIENSGFKELPGDQRDYIESLIAKGVFRQVTTTNARALADTSVALDFVTKWDSFWLSVIVLSPTVISIIITVAWPAVAVLHYDADIQTSVQTATSLASYIVTTGALLIGLVTLFDGLSK